MKTLVVAATQAEISPLLNHFGITGADYAQGGVFDVLITGAGMTATAFALGQQLHNSYSLILNLGIAGSFDHLIPLGTVVNITTDIISELGAQAPDQFLTIDELGFGPCKFHGKQVTGLKNVSGITVNTVHGDPSGIAAIVKRLNPATESMEGAAVFYCAQKAGIACIQVRSISNFVEPRNKNNWKIGLAIKNLNDWAINFITTQTKT